MTALSTPRYVLSAQAYNDTIYVIGGNVTILPGVVLGDNITVGANSVVTKSFEGNQVIAGVPAKVIRQL